MPVTSEPGDAICGNSRRVPASSTLRTVMVTVLWPTVPLGSSTMMVTGWLLAVS